jgi:hypothetical protein
MQDILYFDSYQIGSIENIDTDFPNFTGDFTLTLSGNDDLSNQLLKFIDFSKRQSDFYMGEEYDEELEEKLFDEEETFDNIITSNSWHIIDHSGRKSRILIPIFDSANTINWRLNDLTN